MITAPYPAGHRLPDRGIISGSSNILLFSSNTSATTFLITGANCGGGAANNAGANNAGANTSGIGTASLDLHKVVPLIIARLYPRGHRPLFGMSIVVGSASSIRIRLGFLLGSCGVGVGVGVGVGIETEREEL